MKLEFNDTEYLILSCALTNRRERILQMIDILAKNHGAEDRGVKAYEQELKNVALLEEKLIKTYAAEISGGIEKVK
jgi:hypothetical protein